LFNQVPEKRVKDGPVAKKKKIAASTRVKLTGEADKAVRKNEKETVHEAPAERKPAVETSSNVRNLCFIYPF
jgi:hypothetical protein